MLEVTHLNKNQFQDLLALQSLIQKKEKNNAPIYTHIIRKERPYACNVLIYEGRELIGFSSRFLFHEGQVELSLIIHPKYKTPFMAKKLLTPLLKFIPQNYKNTVVIATPHGQKPDIKPTANWTYMHSSHRLQWQGVAKKPAHNEELEIIKAAPEHFQVFQNIIYTCFPNSTEMAPEIYAMLMENPQVQIFLLKKQNEFVGAIQINHENKSYRISDISILPNHRQSGLARYLLLNICHQLQVKQQMIVLDVESTNRDVLAWYQRLGMKETNVSDFWRIPYQDIF